MFFKRKRWVKPDLSVLPKVSYSKQKSPIVGIDLPSSAVLPFRQAVNTADFRNSSDLLCAVGCAQNKPIYLTLEKLPHLLIAGSTGSGKSVLMNSILCGLLLRHDPNDLHLVIIDCKRVEYTSYRNLPFLPCPPVTDPEKAVIALAGVCEEMDRRYLEMEKRGVNNANGLFGRIVVVIDELADLMLVTKKAGEKLIVRLAQLGRAAGIHLIVATQSPKSSVLTGLIKANIPCKIGLQTSNTTESVCIIGHKGLEKLQGAGNAIVQYGTFEIQIRTPLIVQSEVSAICNYWSNKKLCWR